MDCEKCKEADNCSYYQEWLNTRGSCCPYSDYQKSKRKSVYQPLTEVDSY